MHKPSFLFWLHALLIQRGKTCVLHSVHEGSCHVSIVTHRGKKSGMLCKDLRCLKLYRHVWSLMMRKDQKAMMSLLCGHRRKLCANDAWMFRHVSLHDHFLCMSVALLPGTCWMSHAMKAVLFSWPSMRFLEGKICFWLKFDCTCLWVCVKNNVLPWKNIFASKECAVASAVRCCQVFSVWR